MFILEKPFVSAELKDYLEASQAAVLKNDVALEAATTHELNMVTDAEARERIAARERIYTTSENALDWIYANTAGSPLTQTIDAMKNKAEMRRLLKSVYPDFFFEEIEAENLKNVKFEDLPCPVVLKPSVGFFSVGVYTIQTREDWTHALADIEKTSADWKKLYPESVLGNGKFVIEKYIHGEEYAVDVYFDGDGNAVILNILKHDFSSERDVSDRLYYTSKEIITEKLAPLTEFFNRVNTVLGAKNFPAHVELRVERDGSVCPIEFNPMRFAGCCCTDVGLFAYGIRTYEYFVENKKPDWEKLLEGKDGKVYTMCVLNKPVPCPPIRDFDYDALCAKFERVCCLRKFDYNENTIFGFLYTETTNPEELKFIVNSDLTEFIR
ncbi:MAG: ATP-grasp domain-containing protein [Opitutales bacterium]|nr:ATP-grasp domain-containing protein [Opitutales bacterium]